MPVEVGLSLFCRTLRLAFSLRAGAGNFFSTTPIFERGGGPTRAAAGWEKFSANLHQQHVRLGLPRAEGLRSSRNRCYGLTPEVARLLRLAHHASAARSACASSISGNSGVGKKPSSARASAA